MKPSKNNFKNRPRGQKLKLEGLTFKTFAKALLAAAIFIFAFVGLGIHEGPLKIRLREGDVALKSIYAPYDWTYSDLGATAQIKKGELLIGKGHRVTKAHISEFLAFEASSRQSGKLKFLAGVIILIALLIFAAGAYLVLYEPKIFASIPQLALIGILSIGMIFISRVVIMSPLPTYVIPLAAFSILLAILVNPRVAIFLTVALSFAICVNTEDSLSAAIIFLLGGLAGIFSVRNIRRRWQIMAAGMLVAAANCAAIITVALLNNLSFDTVAADCVWGFINGIICSFIVTGLLPLLEDLFKLTTNITLLEMSDLNHPLLKQMLIKAPGTYHHSLTVGNLAEAAAEATGANPLLARVGAYYHDVGKIEKAEYFSENETDAKSMHDKLTPSMSRLVITNHVKDGVELGKKYKLKQAILDFIEQHHGTGLVYYFFQKALERVDGQEILKEDGYRYPGPKPQTKEAAIVLLADSIEAASRTLSGPIVSRAEEMARRIINDKFIDGQLDECDLALKDLDRIAQAFVRVLVGMLHSRVEYPHKNNES